MLELEDLIDIEEVLDDEKDESGDGSDSSFFDAAEGESSEEVEEETYDPFVYPAMSLNVTPLEDMYNPEILLSQEQILLYNPDASIPYQYIKSSELKEAALLFSYIVQRKLNGLPLSKMQNEKSETLGKFREYNKAIYVDKANNFEEYGNKNNFEKKNDKKFKK